jgi:Lrp/AsnC family leucine-responsive transcriptional regulator
MVATRDTMLDRRSTPLMAYEANLLDEINRRLLEELQRDGRVAFAELGRRVGLSAPAVAERVGRLEREGVITGYRAEVDPRAVGYALAAVVRIRPFARQIHKIPEVAADTPEVVECERITGEDCFLLRLHVRDMEDLEPVLDRFTPFGQTTTSIVHSAPVARRALPLG